MAPSLLRDDRPRIKSDHPGIVRMPVHVARRVDLPELRHSHREVGPLTIRFEVLAVSGLRTRLVCAGDQWARTDCPSGARLPIEHPLVEPQCVRGCPSPSDPRTTCCETNLV